MEVIAGAGHTLAQKPRSAWVSCFHDNKILTHCVIDSISLCFLLLRRIVIHPSTTGASSTASDWLPDKVPAPPSVGCSYRKQTAHTHSWETNTHSEMVGPETNCDVDQCRSRFSLLLQSGPQR